MFRLLIIKPCLWNDVAAKPQLLKARIFLPTIGLGQPSSSYDKSHIVKTKYNGILGFILGFHVAYIMPRKLSMNQGPEPVNS